MDKKLRELVDPFEYNKKIELLIIRSVTRSRGKKFNLFVLKVFATINFFQNK